MPRQPERPSKQPSRKETKSLPKPSSGTAARTPEEIAASRVVEAILSAYDLASPERQQEMEHNAPLTPTEVGEGMTAARIAEVQGVDRKEGVEIFGILRKVSKEIPGIAIILGLVSQNPSEKTPEKEDAAGSEEK